MTPDQIPVLSPDIIWRVLDDGAVLVSPEAGKVRVLNSVGTAIWQLIDGQNSLRDIEEVLVSRYEVDREQAREDLYAFMGELAERELLEWKSNEPTGS